MPTLFVFLFKVNMALLLFCAGYYLVLRHLTFYSLNRVYLITAIIFASVYPKIDLTAFAQRHENIALPVQSVILNWQAPAAKLVKPLAQPDYWQWATIVFWAGAALLAIRLLVQLFSLLKLHRRSTSANVLNHHVRLISGEAAPFSFWRSIYVNPANHSAADLKAILLHEQVHVNGWHTIDILLAELSSIFYWFNPGVWLMKKAVRENIEFITDRKILNNGIDTKAYQYSLVNVSFNATTPGIVNHFNISTIKKRIIMMNAKRSSRVNLTRYAFVVPAVALLLVFSFSNAAVVKKNGVKAYKAISNTITENLKDVMPSVFIDKVIDSAKPNRALSEDNDFGYPIYVNGIKKSTQEPLPHDNESMYFLSGRDAKKYLNIGNGEGRVTFTFTTNSTNGKALKDKIEKLIAENKVKREQVSPEGLAKLNAKLVEMDSFDKEMDAERKANFTSTPNKENYGALVIDTTKKTSFKFTTNNISLLDSLNYVLNGKKITIEEFNKIDPNKIIAVNIVTADIAKTMLNDYDSMNFKPHSKILFVTTSDSEKGKQLAEALGVRQRITAIRINGKDLSPMQADSIVINNVRLTKNLKLRKSGDLLSRDMDSVVIVGNGTKNLYRMNSDLATVSGFNTLTYSTTSPADVNKRLNTVSLYARSGKNSDIAEVRALQGNVFYSDKNISRISDKLIVIDGKEATEKDLKKLSAFDIDRMSTSSDADTVKKYGAKAKYGVVYIYTKKAK
ncbi:M56 family metallopeptidase [Mucilaginibacter sp.]|uniref:M56 family metallopeptidase n=1 Tax=Mucilaginibacter sp. TaxID=1882438 RepID=UPI0032665C6F